MTRSTLILNDKNMESLARFIGKQMNINQTILDILANQKDLEFAKDELGRLIQDQAGLSWVITQGE